MRRPRIYIAGPITHGDLADNIRIASEAFFALLKAGFAPLCPHWSAYSGGPYDRPEAQRLPCGTTHADWMDADLPWVEAADVVLRLPGHSPGSDREVEHANRSGVPVLFDMQSCLKFIEGWQDGEDAQYYGIV